MSAVPCMLTSSRPRDFGVTVVLGITVVLVRTGTDDARKQDEMMTMMVVVVVVDARSGN